MSTPKHIAVIRTDRLGDMVLTLPMFPVLRECFPEAKLYLIASRYVEPLVRNIDCIDTAIFLKSADQAIGPILRSNSIDTLFSPRPRLSESWQALTSGVRRRIGSGYRWYSPLYNTRIYEHRSDAAFHEAEYNVRMIMHAFGGPMPKVRLLSPRPNFVRTSHKRPRVVIHPGSGGSAADWPADRFGNVASILERELDAEIIVTGIEGERQLCEVVTSQCSNATNLCGLLDLSAMIDLLADSSVLLANSTGVLHIAASLSTPVVGFYPSTPSMSPRRWGPYSENAIVLESGEGDNMLEIDVSEAVKATKQIISRSISDQG